MEGFENQRRNREVDEATLVELVRNRGFTIVPMEGDGNCMFRAIAHQMYGDQDMHDQIRLLTMNYMEVNRDYYSQYVYQGPASVEKWLEKDPEKFTHRGLEKMALQL